MRSSCDLMSELAFWRAMRSFVYLRTLEKVPGWNSKLVEKRPRRKSCKASSEIVEIISSSLSLVSILSWSQCVQSLSWKHWAQSGDTCWIGCQSGKGSAPVHTHTIAHICTYRKVELAVDLLPFFWWEEPSKPIPVTARWEYTLTGKSGHIKTSFTPGQTGNMQTVTWAQEKTANCFLSRTFLHLYMPTRDFQMQLFYQAPLWILHFLPDQIA